MNNNREPSFDSINMNDYERNILSFAKTNKTQLFSHRSASFRIDEIDTNITPYTNINIEKYQFNTK